MGEENAASRKSSLVAGTVLGRALVAVALAAGCFLLSAAPVQAEFGIAGFDGRVDADAAGAVYTQAGGHPYAASTKIDFNGGMLPDADVKTIRVDLPAGFTGDPRVTLTRCTADELVGGGIDSNPLCPFTSQVGIAVIRKAGIAGLVDIAAPIFNMVPPPGAVAAFGMNIGNVPVYMKASLRPDDYGVSIIVDNVSQGLPLLSSNVEFWGFPADPVHDPQRCSQPDETTVPPNTCTGDGADPNATPHPVDAPIRPFLTNPTSCTPAGVGLETKLTVDSWENPGVFERASFFSHLPAPDEAVQQGPDGCERLPFDPSMKVTLGSSTADAPSGLSVALKIPQPQNPNGLESAHLKDVNVSLPDGLTINPSAAGGLQACGDDQLRQGEDTPMSCPLASKIGTVEATTPLLAERLTGGVYLRPQNSLDPASGEMFRIAIEIANEDRGISVRLPGSVKADPTTGKLTATFERNPQLPVSDIALDLKGGPRAPLATPADCGDKSTVATLTSWGGQIAGLANPATITCPGAAALNPEFEAGMVSPSAGRYSPLVLSLARPDGQSFMDKLSVTMPTGLSARLKGAVGQQIGTVQAAAGAGSPFWLPGRVYLEGPYDGAPFSLRVVVPAKAGPFDLGEVVVRQRVFVDPTDAHVRVVSDPLPTIVGGVPTRLREIRVNIDRGGFTLNPTSCDAKQVGADVGAVDGSAVAKASRFQAGDCAALPFTPRLSVALTGRNQVTTGKHPGVKAVVKQAGVGEAGIEKAKVTLPKSLALDPENAQALCEFVDGTKPDIENHCPKGSIIGRARAATPLLDRPLAGNVYFVKNVERNPRTGALIRKLPMLVVALRGEIAINLVGKSTTAKDGRLVNTFGSVPDAPISRFNLSIQGGGNGILAVTRTRQARINLCAGRHAAEVAMDGQNGRHRAFDVAVKTPCTKRQVKKARTKKK